jgi:hypothetical protein
LLEGSELCWSEQVRVFNYRAPKPGARCQNLRDEVEIGGAYHDGGLIGIACNDGLDVGLERGLGKMSLSTGWLECRWERRLTMTVGFV